jgi:EpsI family protein
LPSSFITASALLVAFIVSAIAIARPAEVFPARTSFVEFPVKLADWQGHRQALEAVFTDQLKLDDYLLADYANDSGNLVNLYIAYYDSQRKGEAVHSPRSCLPGDGWQMRDFGQRELPGLSAGGRPLRVNRTLIELGNQRQLVYYWFQQRGRIITNEFAVKWFLFWDALTLHRTDGAMVRLITPLAASGSEADADRRLTELASRVERELPRFVPN